MSLRHVCRPVRPDAEEVCDHGGPALPTDPDDLDLFGPCDAAGAVHTPWPQTQVVGSVVVCEWHLARLLAAYPDLEAKLRERFAEQDHDLDDYLPDHAFVSLDDAPAEFPYDDGLWFRCGLDQRGEAHYRRDGGEMVLVLGPDFEVRAANRVSVSTWMEYVRGWRGWAEVDWPEEVTEGSEPR
jgi:hypothetical protein